MISPAWASRSSLWSGPAMASQWAARARATRIGSPASRARATASTARARRRAPSATSDSATDRRASTMDCGPGRLARRRASRWAASSRRSIWRWSNRRTSKPARSALHPRAAGRRPARTSSRWRPRAAKAAKARAAPSWSPLRAGAPTQAGLSVRRHLVVERARPRRGLARSGRPPPPRPARRGPDRRPGPTTAPPRRHGRAPTEQVGGDDRRFRARRLQRRRPSPGGAT